MNSDSYTIPWIGPIPNDWSISPLYSLAIEPKRKNNLGKEDKVLSLSYGKIIVKDTNDNFGLLPESFNTYQIVKPGEIVMRLTDLQNDKKSLRIGQVKEQGIITSAYTDIKFNSSLNSQYMYYLLHSYDIKKVFYGLGGGVRQSIGFYELKHLPILIPPFAMQSKIASDLSEKEKLIDNLISKKQKLIELLKEKRSAIIHQAVTKGLDPNVEMVESGVDWIGKIPKGWKIQNIKSYVKSRYSGVWGEDAKDDENDIKCARIADFDYDNFSITQVDTIRNIGATDHNKILNKGTILIEKSGGGENQPVGRAVLFNKDEKMVCANFIEAIELKNDVDPKYFVFILSTAYSAKVNTKSIKQNTGLQNLDIKEYFSELITFPPKNEQISISGYLKDRIREMNKAVENILLSINLLNEYKQSLISNVVTGKVRI